MQSENFYTLTVHYYPQAVEAPLAQGESYRSYSFNFSNPPTPEDFKNLVKKLPWAYGAWEDTLIPILDTNPWPYLTLGTKSASVKLFVQDFGTNKQVGHLEVSKDEIIKNDNYPRILFPCNLFIKLSKKYKEAERADIREFLEQNKMNIIGILIKQSRKTGIFPTEAQIVNTTRQFLKQWISTRQNA